MTCISIPFSTIKRIIAQNAMDAVNRFQFHLVRLKVYWLYCKGTVFPFQFHLVRLKEEWDLVFALIAENFNSI